MDKVKEYKNTGLSVEDRILEGICGDCDQDPAKCYERDFCIYDAEEVTDEH